MPIAVIARDITRFTVQNVNDAISFKPHLCHEVPPAHYETLRQEYIAFTGTSIRKNKCKLFYLPTNVSDEMKFLDQSYSEHSQIPIAKIDSYELFSSDEGQVCPDSISRMSGLYNPEGNVNAAWRNKGNGRTVYYKKRLITELDYENVKRVEKACMLIAYAAVNQCLRIETCRNSPVFKMSNSFSNHGGSTVDEHEECDRNSKNNGEYCEECARKSLERGEMLGFRELGYLINITPWHFHRVFKVIAGLTIWEYGQLCCDFLKGQEDILFRVRDKVASLRESGEAFSCLHDEEFMREDLSFFNADYLDNVEQEDPSVNIVFLPDYFIDPNKSKESKKRLKEQKCNGVVADGSINKVKVRKRRYSSVSHRVMEASSSSIVKNPTLIDCLENSTLTRDEYERRQKQKNLQCNRLRMRRKGSATAPLVRKPQPHTRSSIDVGNVLKDSIVKHESDLLGSVPSSLSTEQDETHIQEQIQLQQSEHPNDPLSVSAFEPGANSLVFHTISEQIEKVPSSSSASSALLSSYDHRQDTHSMGHFSTPTQSLADFKFSNSLLSDNNSSDFNALLDIGPSENPINSVSSLQISEKPSSTTPVQKPDSASSTSTTGDIFLDLYRYTLGVSPNTTHPDRSAILTPTTNNINQESAALSAYNPINTAPFDNSNSTSFTPTNNSVLSSNYSLASILYLGAPQHQMLDFEPLFGSELPVPISTPAYNTLFASSAGFFKDDDEAL